MHVQFGFHQSHAGTVALRPIKLVPVLNHLHSLEMEGDAKWVTVSPQVHLPSAGVQGFCNNRAPRYLTAGCSCQPVQSNLPRQSTFLQLRLQGKHTHLRRLSLGIRQTPGTPSNPPVLSCYLACPDTALLRLATLTRRVRACAVCPGLAGLGLQGALQACGIPAGSQAL